MYLAKIQTHPAFYACHFTCNDYKNQIKAIEKSGESVFLMGIFCCSRAANSAVSGLIRPNVNSSKMLCIILFTCKFKKDWINDKCEKVETSLFQTLKGCLFHSEKSDLAKIQTHTSFTALPRYLRVKRI